MFKYYKEMRELKKRNLLYTTALLGRLYDFVDAIPDIAELAQNLQGLDSTDLQKGIAESLVGFVKDNEKK